MNSTTMRARVQGRGNDNFSGSPEKTTGRDGIYLRLVNEAVERANSWRMMRGIEEKWGRRQRKREVRICLCRCDTHDTARSFFSSRQHAFFFPRSHTHAVGWAKKLPVLGRIHSFGYHGFLATYMTQQEDGIRLPSSLPVKPIIRFQEQVARTKGVSRNGDPACSVPAVG